MGKTYLFNYEKGKAQEPIRFVDSFITGLIQDSYKSPIKRLQDSYQEIAGLSSRDCRTPINFL